MKRIAFATIVALQLADLTSTWIGIHRGLAEADGTSFVHLVLLKLGMLALLGILLHRRSVKAVWIACGSFAAIMVPIIASNFNLIARAR
jgi:hypothetical protein